MELVEKVNSLKPAPALHFNFGTSIETTVTGFS
jgi:hypothetical protein